MPFRSRLMLATLRWTAGSGFSHGKEHVCGACARPLQSIGTMLRWMCAATMRPLVKLLWTFGRSAEAGERRSAATIAECRPYKLTVLCRVSHHVPCSTCIIQLSMAAAAAAAAAAAVVNVIRLSRFIVFSSAQFVDRGAILHYMPPSSDVHRTTSLRAPGSRRKFIH